MSRSFCSVRGSKWSLGAVTWPTSEIMLWNFGVFIAGTKSSGRGQTQLEAADGWLCFGGSLGVSSMLQPLSPGPSEPWREKQVKEHAGKMAKTRSICLRNHPKDQILFLMVVLPDGVKAAAQFLPLPPILGVRGPRDAKSCSPLATGWEKHFCCSRDLGSSIQEWQSLHPMLRPSPPPRAKLLAPRCLQRILHAQPGAPAPSNALSACENIHLQQQRGENKFFGAHNFTWLCAFKH